jgi:hypothetical protein
VSATDSRLIRDPFVGNVIPLKQLDPVALKIQALVPNPQGPNATQLINNYNNPFQTKTQSYIPSIKLDHSLSSIIEGYPNANIINTNGSYAFGRAETGQINDVFNRAQHKYLSVYSRPLVSNINFSYTVPGWGTQ